MIADPKGSQGQADAPHTAPARQASADPDGAAPLPLVPGQTEVERDALLPMPKAAKPRPANSGQGVGRPTGARNRRTDLMARYLVDRYGDPLEGTVSVGMMPIRELITELNKVASDTGIPRGYSVMDVVRLQADLRAQALPFIHAKRGPENEKGDPVLPVVGIGRVEHVHRVEGGNAVSIEDRLAQAKVIENKGQSDDTAK